jgi:hypothetical protein
MWIEPLGACSEMQSARVVFACKNVGFESVDVRYKLGLAKKGLVRIDGDLEGIFVVEPTRPWQSFEFDFDFAQLTSLVAERKENCRIDWEGTVGSRYVAVTTRIPVVTK